MGRDWLRVVTLDWRKVSRVSTSASLENRVVELQEQFQEVFSGTLGTITPFQALLSVMADATPKFFKPCSVPFALRERVENELDRLEEAGVLEKTYYSEWAAPVVVVPKQEGHSKSRLGHRPVPFAQARGHFRNPGWRQTLHYP